MPTVFKTSILLKRIARFERAAIAKAWMGTQHPDDYRKIETAYTKARSELISYILEHHI